MTRKTAIAAALAVALAGCDSVKRVDVDGVDCVTGSGHYGTTAAVSCDWANKQPRGTK